MRIINDIEYLEKMVESYPNLTNNIKYVERMLNNITHISYDIISECKDLDTEQKNDNLLKIVEIANDIKPITMAAIIICFNEEDSIIKCISSIQKCDFEEIIVIDTGSTDKTMSILNEIVSTTPNLKIYSEPWEDDFSKARNLGIDVATSDWIFFIDADEYYLEDDTVSIKEQVTFFSNYYEGDLCICPTIINTNQHELYNNPRIFRKSSGYRYKGCVHEILFKKSNLYEFILNIGLNIRFKHTGYDNDIYIKKDKTNRNIKLLRKNIMIEPENPLWRCYLIRDGRRSLDKNEIEDNYNQVVEVSKGKDDYYHRFTYYWASSLILDYFMDKKLLNEAKQILNVIKLNDLEFNKSDIFYREQLLSIYEIEKNILEKIIEVKAYRKDNMNTKGSELNTEGYHLDELIMRLYYMNHNMHEFYKYKELLFNIGYLI